MHAISDLLPFLEDLYRGIELGESKVTLEELKNFNFARQNLVYGELCFESLAMVICRKCNLPRGGIFYDIGSGAGRGVFSAMLMHNFDVCVGVEIVQVHFSFVFLLGLLVAFCSSRSINGS